MAQDHVRILVIDRQPLFREAVSVVLGALQGYEVVGGIGDAAEGAAEVAVGGIDLVLLDKDLPKIGSPQSFVQLLRRYSPATRIVLVGDEEEIDGLAVAVETGADGYLSRTMSATDFAARAVDAAAGIIRLPDEARDELEERLKQRGVLRSNEARLLAGLSPTERRLTWFLTQGMGPEEVAAETGVSVREARWAIRQLLVMLDVTSVEQLREILKEEAEH